MTLKFKTTVDASGGPVNSPNVKLAGDVQWKEQTISDNNTVAISAPVLGAAPENSAPDTSYEITLTPSAVQPNAGRLLSMTIEATGPEGLLLYSRETADQPQLIVSYKYQAQPIALNSPGLLL